PPPPPPPAYTFIETLGIRRTGDRPRSPVVKSPTPTATPLVGWGANGRPFHLVHIISIKMYAGGRSPLRQTQLQQKNGQILSAHFFVISAFASL
ncbi:MAG: hypothetical protein FWG68_12290, partial [Defluviitaleaceae bacterium]|nr:hypothetical protein [Defluviitaleaceae bacterium]